MIFFTLAAFTGLRRGELLGLEWKDFDFENRLMTVVRTSEWTKEKGIYTDTPKTKSSNRMLKLPAGLVTQLLQFKKWQDKYKLKIGSKWVETDRLFTKWNGEPMGMRSPYKFFEKFCKRTGMRFVNIHSFRHHNNMKTHLLKFKVYKQIYLPANRLGFLKSVCYYESRS